MKCSPVNELELFITEVNRLTSKSFYQVLNSGEEIGFSDGSFPENTPTVEQLESYLLHFRKFIQKNDRVYFRLVNQYVNELAIHQANFLDEWNIVYKAFEELMEAKALTGRVITHVPDIPDLSLLDLFRARTFGDLSHLDSKKQLLHQKLSSTSQLEALYRFEYYTFLSEAGEVIAEMANLCTRLLHSLNNQV
ncbi:hypothetical protein DO97_20740 [Neosynechococcus sphagnicola sy1]|uniref:Uncharacterized protein n=1 Tax=Neosynechococcus sphagnicola sy1 TaxID=1497020 RepID=A0A098TFS0_9CYAN|nr:hypothetical protein [Neosynechococcus sphagnicola]KGF71400.1 hypothetical protein DO97_20740 [Neosynechococcus sphagnicola sy1]